jgi:uncharacterized membrane-anchored protein
MQTYNKLMQSVFIPISMKNIIKNQIDLLHFGIIHLDLKYYIKNELSLKSYIYYYFKVTS